MNLSEMIAAVNRDIDDDVDSGDITSWLNRCLDELTPITRLEAKYVTPITPAVTLPSDVFEIVLMLADDKEIYRVATRDKHTKGYKIWGKEITLQNAPLEGFLEVYYYKRLSHLENEDDVPEIEPAFHDLLVLYAIAMSQYADEEPERQVDAMNRYLARRQEYEAYIMRNENSSYEIKELGW